jgi:plastocyanin
VRRAGLALFAAAALLGGAVPAWSGEDGKVAPVAALSVSPSAVTAGEPVALDASGSRDQDGTVTSYAWDLDGDGAFERQSGSEATVAHAFESAGTHSVGVRVLDDSGESADATASVEVAEQPAPEPQPEPEPEADAEQPPAPAAAADRKSEPKAKRARATRAEEPEPERVSAAASQTVSIRDFSFAPKSVTVSVGDTVTWRNTGKEVHTATAKDGSFDTGNIASGGSGSATFKKAGTFAYFCKPHAFMTASVTVTGGGSGGGGAGGSGGGSQGVTGSGDDGSTGGSGTGTSAGGELPSTGLAIGPFVLMGIAMVASGVALRRRCATPAR